jgi:hypothetical protein
VPEAVSEVLFPVTIAEQAAVANAVESCRQHVEYEAPDKLAGRRRHRFLRVPHLDNLILKPHLPLFHVEQSRIGDGDAVRVATDVVQDLLWSGEGGFAYTTHSACRADGSIAPDENPPSGAHVAVLSHPVLDRLSMGACDIMGLARSRSVTSLRGHPLYPDPAGGSAAWNSNPPPGM